MRYKNLLFDLYGTLVDIHTVEDIPVVWRKLALFFGYHGARYTAPELREAYFDVVQAQNATAGQSYECFPDLPVEETFARLFAQKGVTRDAERLADEAAQVYRILCTRHLRLYPGVRKALKSLRQDGHRLYLLSNAQAAFTARELELLGLTPMFDKVYLSSDYRCRKPDVRFFDALLQGEGLSRGDCLMIGNDVTSDIAGARAAGLDSLYLHTNLSPDVPGGKLPGTYALEETDWRKILPYLRTICW